jgi:hypothetical protein
MYVFAGQQQQMRALAFGHRPFPFSAADALGQAGACSLSALPAPLSNPFGRTKPGDPLGSSLSNLKVPGSGSSQGQYLESTSAYTVLTKKLPYLFTDQRNLQILVLFYR